MVARVVRDDEVVGSNPASPTNTIALSLLLFYNHSLMNSESSIETTHRLRTERFVAAAVTGPILEMMQNIPGIHQVMPEPFDITNHAGNMWGGSTIAMVGTALYAARTSEEPKTWVIDDESMSRFRKFGVSAICGAAALINCVTETKWGVSHLPVAGWLHGKTPDPLDTLYSTV